MTIQYSGRYRYVYDSIYMFSSADQVVVIEETTTVDEEVVVEDPPLAAVQEEPEAVQEEPEATPPPAPEEATPRMSKSKSRQSPLSPARVQRLHEKEELQVRKRNRFPYCYCSRKMVFNLEEVKLFTYSVAVTE